MSRFGVAFDHDEGSGQTRAANRSGMGVTEGEGVETEQRMVTRAQSMHNRERGYQLLLNLQPERLEFHQPQGARPIALSRLKANMIKPRFHMLYGFRSLVTLHSECLKTSVNIRFCSKQGPGVTVGNVGGRQIQIKIKESNTHQGPPLRSGTELGAKGKSGA